MTQYNHALWVRLNQQYLAARMHDVVQSLQSSVDSAVAIDFSASDALANQMKNPPALSFVAGVFGLSPFEQFTLLLCVGYELDRSFAQTLKQFDPLSAPRPSFEVAMSLFVDSHWSAITPVAPLRHWRLVELENGASVVSSALIIDERILHFLSGVSYLDTRLQDLMRFDSQTPLPSSSLEPCIRQIVACYEPTAQIRTLPVIQVCGKRGSDMKSVVLNACKRLNLLPYALNVEDIPRENQEREAFIRLLQRESFIDRIAVVVSSKSENESLLKNFVRDLFFPCFIIDRQPVELESRATIRIDVPTLNSAEQISIWKGALGEKAKNINGDLRHLVSQFNLSAQNIAHVSQQLSADDSDKNELTTKLWLHCRIQSRKRLDSLAKRVESELVWDDLVLQPAQKQTLNDIIAQTRHRFKVYQEWGFKNKSVSGQGISAIFFGSSGTGKTMAAAVIANELQLDLYHIDLSQVVNKYIGETEKNLARLFDAAEDSGAILLFDEADSLFAKRTEVKNSHDRNANLETSYLLQRMESYCGLALLTTNLKKEMDSAFMRRIGFSLQFPFPDVDSRKQIWQRMFPEETPLDNIDFSKLASLDVAGGNIRNIALNAAFLAAQDNQAVAMTHLAKAARRELGKIDKTIKESELRSWL